MVLEGGRVHVGVASQIFVVLGVGSIFRAHFGNVEPHCILKGESHIIVTLKLPALLLKTYPIPREGRSPDDSASRHSVLFYMSSEITKSLQTWCRGFLLTHLWPPTSKMSLVMGSASPRPLTMLYPPILISCRPG